jgi:hypothetical protein
MNWFRSLTQFCLGFGYLASLLEGCHSQPPQAPAERGAASQAETIALEGFRSIDDGGQPAIEDGTS